MNIKSFFNKLFGRKHKTAETMAPVPVISKISKKNPKSHVVIRMGQRKRGFGAKRADGRWMSPFDIWMLKRRGMNIASIRTVFGRQAVDWAMGRKAVKWAAAR